MVSSPLKGEIVGVTRDEEGWTPATETPVIKISDRSPSGLPSEQEAIAIEPTYR